MDDEIKSEWSNILNFYNYTYYVYQYATSFTASCTLSEKVLSGDQSTKKKFMRFLSSGGSDYPIELLKKARISMTTSELFDLTLREMDRVIVEMEKILDRMQK